ncbi:hypothetical protein SDC9_96665 [bioreactor metagenome]|uniref:Uncharacterized protein n=1 Tax=bioreactor metagenome TaxID=1076179 RepID=A0A645ACD1_9ZZZZ
MSSDNSIDWQIESIRFTSFMNQSLNSTYLEHWVEEVSKNSLSKVNKTPSSFTGLSSMALGVLRANWVGNRLDIVLSAEDPKKNQTILPWSESDNLFVQVFDRVPEICEPNLFDRIAIGLVLTSQVANDMDGNRALSKMIVGVSVPETVKDFLYRVNYPCGSKTSGEIFINRLAIWSVGHSQLFEVVINEDGSQSEKLISEDPAALRLELDINTDKNTHLKIDKTNLQNLLGEFKSIIKNICSDGEITLR